jgi:hypothetical protein
MKNKLEVIIYLTYVKRYGERGFQLDHEIIVFAIGNRPIDAIDS